MLGVDKSTSISSLLPIGTGEDKSVVLGILSTLLALIGFDVSFNNSTNHYVLKYFKVYRASYSTYLSQRDFDSFKDLFSRFGVLDYIHYSTISQLTKQFRKYEDISELHECFSDETTFAPLSPRKNILLIDEVDVFFNQDFYNNISRQTDASEELFIKGRTARQGKKGTYTKTPMVLHLPFISSSFFGGHD